MRHIIHASPAGRGRAAALALVLALLFILASLPAAFAHAMVIRSDPPDGGVISAAPAEIRLWFSEPVQPEVAEARVLDANGAVVPGTTATLDPADPTLLVLRVPGMTEGVYNVVYAVLAEDGHPTQGHVAFTVAAAAGRRTAGAAPVTLPVAPAEVLLRWLNFVALAAVTGAVAVALTLLGPRRLAGLKNRALAGSLGRARVRVLRWGGAAALAGLVVGAALLVWQAALFVLPAGAAGNPAGATTLAGALVRLLGSSRTGGFWLLHESLLLVLGLLMFALASRDGRALGPIPPALVLFVAAGMLTQALAGHAAAVTPAPALAVAADTLHLLAAGLWAGGLLALAVGLLPMVLAGRGTPAFAALAGAGWRPFGVLAAASVGVLFATGLYSLGREVASPDALLTTFYGRVLTAKVVLVLATGFFGLLNSSLLHPAVAAPLAHLFRRPAGWTPVPLSRFPALISAELALGLLVFLATAAMTSTVPANGPQFAPAPVAVAHPLTQPAGDLNVTLEATPNRPGQNIIVVQVADTRQPAPAEIMRVIVRFVYQGSQMGTTFSDAHLISPGVYQVVGEQLSLAGPWQIQVAVRRKGLEDITTAFAWTVAPPSVSRPVVISNRPLEPLLTPAAGGLLVAILLVAGWAGLRRPRGGLGAERTTRAPR